MRSSRHEPTWIRLFGDACERGGRAAAKPARRRPVKDQVIQLRVSAETKALLIRAAALDGRSLSDYMVRSAERGAIDAVLDRREWLLDQKDFEALLDLLDDPAPPPSDVVERLSRRPPWR